MTLPLTHAFAKEGISLATRNKLYAAPLLDHVEIVKMD